jgi:hypothetical protein
MRFYRGKIFATTVWFIFVGLIVYQVYFEYTPCKKPVEYKIGTIDPRFGVSAADFKKDIAEAGNLWSAATGKTLFEYSDQGALTINLIYDDRQKITQQEKQLSNNIDATTEVAQSVKDQFNSLQNNYNAAQTSYKDELGAYNTKQTDYNNQVEYWNTQGGAPANEYQKLQTQKNDLSVERASLEQKRLAVNSLANQINALIDKYNLLVNHINENVNAINNDGLAGTQFEEGVYISDKDGMRINIYQFDNQTYFLRVLSHELGHSLGLQHNNGANSIMNPVNQSKSLALSTEDIAAIDLECGIK